MNRRTILKYTALATGAAVGAPLMSAILSGCKSEGADKTLAEVYQPKFFNKNEMGQLRDIVDVILPKTDSPAASEVGVPNIIDSMIGEVYTAEQRTKFREAFNALSEFLKKADFSSKTAAEQVQILKTLDASKDENLRNERNAYLDLKQQTIAYYLSNEEIGTKYLNYLPVPGKYEACISLEEAGGKLWAI